MYICDECTEMLGGVNCLACSYGNPCLGCRDYDEEKDTCKSNGGCADVNNGFQVPFQNRA